MPKVFITNKSAHDFSAAEPYGEFHYLSEGLVHKYSTNKTMRLFEDRLKHSEADDYLLITSLGVLNVIAAGILATKHHKINLLIYNATEKTYVERTIKFNPSREE